MNLFHSFKGLSHVTKRRLILLVIIQNLATALAAALVVYFSDLFSLGIAWGCVIAFFIWGWFTALGNGIVRHFFRGMMERWVTEDIDASA